MIEDLKAQSRELKRGKIISETAKIPWLDLQRYFAGGKVMVVDPSLDLVDAAFAIQEDDLPRVQVWTEQQLLAPATDEQARTWFESDASLWAVVIKPWVLVQTIREDQQDFPAK